LRIVAPAAVITVAFRITVGREPIGRYVLGKGSELGVESAPAPTPARAAESLRDVDAGVGAVRGRCVAQASAAQERANAALRIAA